MTISTFTVRDLNRTPRKVLDAADRLGIVEVHSRDARFYSIVPRKHKHAAFLFPDFAARRKASGMKMMTRRQSKALDRLMAGE
jgi:hypothetical protein